MAGAERRFDGGGPGGDAGPLERFSALRRRVAEDGWVSGADRDLARLVEEAILAAAPHLPESMALVAVGGFGRGSLALRSDVDLLALVPEPGEVGEPEAVVGPLRATGIRVVCAVHTARSARALAGSRLDAISLFLTARLLAGDREPFVGFRSRFSELLDREYGRIVDGMAMEEARRRAEDPYRRRARDLKAGRGGLRTLDLLDWRRRLGAAVGLPASEPTDAEREARHALTVLRSAVHAVSGEASDRLDPTRESRVAEWMGRRPGEASELAAGIGRAAEHLVDATWPEVGRMLGRVERRPLPEPDAPALVAAVRFARRPDRVPFPDPEPVARWTPADRSAFLELLRPERRAVFDRLLVSGWIEAVMPELDAVFRTSRVGAGAHRWEAGGHTLALLDALADMDGRTPSPAVSAPPDPELLRWAALFHDAGVPAGREGHAGRSAGVAVAVAGRLGLDVRATRTLERLVRHHELLAWLARARRFEDEAAVATAAELIGDLATLRVLHPLAVADLRASGRTARRMEERIRLAHRAVERVLWRSPRPAA